MAEGSGVANMVCPAVGVSWGVDEAPVSDWARPGVSVSKLVGVRRSGVGMSESLEQAVNTARHRGKARRAKYRFIQTTWSSSSETEPSRIRKARSEGYFLSMREIMM